VSAYLTSNIDRIEALDPDLVLAFSDLQAGIVHDLVRLGRTVVTVRPSSRSCAKRGSARTASSRPET
jgi:ABC-type Fe3+-hydroxamate transport system substrate-binding protein